MVKRVNGGFLVEGHEKEPFRNTGKGGKRFWSARRSKLAAFALVRGGFDGILPDGDALYLGAGNGYTVSFISDVAPNARIFAVEFSPMAARDLIDVAKGRKNIFPIVADARNPGTYMPTVPRPTWLLQDISQGDQLNIFTDNVAYMNEGVALLSLKVESLHGGISVKKALETIPDKLSGFCTVLEAASLEPYEKGHAMFLTLPRATKN